MNEFSLAKIPEDVTSHENLPGVDTDLIRKLISEAYKKNEKETKFVNEIGKEDNGFIIVCNNFIDQTK